MPSDNTQTVLSLPVDGFQHHLEITIFKSGQFIRAGTALRDILHFAFLNVILLQWSAQCQIPTPLLSAQSALTLLPSSSCLHTPAASLATMELGSCDPYRNLTSLTGLIFQKHLPRLRAAGCSSVKQIKLSIITTTGVIQKQETRVQKL